MASPLPNQIALSASLACDMPEMRRLAVRLIQRAQKRHLGGTFALCAELGITPRGYQRMLENHDDLRLSHYAERGRQSRSY